MRAAAMTANRPTAPAPAPGAGRRVLLLQGPRSPFFARLSDALEAMGAETRRVLFCPGDELHWIGRPALRWRGPLAQWPAACARMLAETGATDVVGLGDGRALHRAGFAQARKAGALVHVVEQGWLRPGWLTLEPDALGAWRPDWSAPRPPAAPASAEKGAPFAAWAAMDVAHDLATLAAGWALYPGYRRHALANPLAEWLGWGGKLARWPARRAARAQALREMAATQARGAPLFLFALQLETDFQIRDRGPAGGVRAALETALASFARAAPAGARLVVKPHPLDPQPWRWARLAAAGGALFLDGGAVEPLFPQLAGVVTVNSTVGLAALRAGTPAAALGGAVYGPLTHPGPLDDFWRAPQAPSPARVAEFVDRMAAEIQTPGAFDGPGMAVGAEGAARLILRRAPGSGGGTP
ncbi:capsular biosynthesis protein [Rubrimonas cliftonensis]|uniref:Capsular polysaccharide export protein n=1 Tax=Rubrimonas cliftonensis TaxID=89524 RepID=A0A1H4FMM0_9RHOB|nr:capsular biosynthesis protein [Rubrimonas cliftonensis]SEA98556.1 capsular polysaccharide export protein [Rubrimonas cliftonensis]